MGDTRAQNQAEFEKWANEPVELLEDVKNIENLPPEQQQEVLERLKENNDTNNIFTATPWDTDFVQPVNDAVQGFLPFSIPTIIVGAVIVWFLISRIKRMMQVAARKKASTHQRNNELLLEAALKADRSDEIEELEEQLETLKATFEVRSKNLKNQNSSHSN